MGLILIIVIIITAYGTDLLLQRILHTTHEEADLLRAIDALADEVRTHRVRQNSVDREVALLCAAADGDVNEYNKIREESGTATPEEMESSIKANGTGPDARSKSQAARRSQIRLAVAASLAFGALIGSCLGHL
ncbi:uncharacterized protein CcaverHIS019_0101560 [Cutaneotrichosporon cavernicola]|uniref:Uncharacterized protein n=1 Tax=Cutaneotrichosporon cavernicola TaxID=279322 RepID=A0AA48IHR9_9TREE|nr:uncharacterized protein CcaverHIS019_0101560 [Cutaneotrichosporon cavernicola]BEI87438.1 hypothetical protein CcaverHIS019_0101560 [Cutaneotrichosporon cavernicola]